MTPQTQKAPKIKEYFLAGVVLLLSLLSFLGIRFVFPIQDQGTNVLASQYPIIVGPLVAILVLTVSQSVLNILLRNPWLVLGEAILLSLGMVIVVGPSLLVVILAIVGIGLLMLSWASTQMRINKQKHLGIRWATKSAIGILIWFVALVSTATFYGSYARTKGPEDIQIPKSAITIAERFVTNVLSDYAPGVSLSTPVGELTQQFESAIPDNLPPELDNTIRNEHRIPTKDELERAIQANPSLLNDQRVRELRSALADGGIEQPNELYRTLLALGKTKPNETVLDGIVQFANGQLQGVLKPYAIYIPMIITLLYFLALRFFASILRLVMVPVIAGLLWMLREAKFYSITKQEEEVDVLTIT